MTLEDIKNAVLGNLGTLVTLLFIIYTGYKKWWVFGWYAKELADRNERMEKRLDRATGQAESATDLAKSSISNAPEVRRD